MMRFNEVKRELLGILRDQGESTVLDIADQIGRTRESVGMALLSYHRMGLVHRQTLRGRTKIYSISERGRERLEYLNACATP